MTAYLLDAIPSRATDSNGAPVPFAKLHTYTAGTTTPLAAYTDITGATPLSNPIVADAGGFFPQIWVSSAAYKLEARKADDVTVLWQRDNVQTAAAIVLAYETALAAASGAGLVGYSRGQTYAAGTIGAAIKHLLPNLITDYDAVGDGVANDTTPWQNALNDGVMFTVPPGTYKVTAGLDWKHGSRALCSGMWSAIASTYETTSTSVIQYAGAGGLNSYVVKVSDAAMGVGPTVAGTRDMQNCALTDVHIDGGDLAEFGLVEVRSWAGNNFDNISISNTRRCGNWAVQDWVTGPRNRHIYKNRGAGAWLGKDIFNWAALTPAQTTTVDQCTLVDWLVYYNGCDQSGTPYNTFADTGGTNPTSANADATCGIGLYGDRALTFIGLQSQKNDGPGIYFATTLFPIRLIQPYVEDNSLSSGSSKYWSTWFASTSSSRGIIIDGGYDGNPSAHTPAHRLQGTSTSRPEQSFLFRDVNLVGTVDADTGFIWRMENSDRLIADGGTLTIVGQGPTNFVKQNGTTRSTGISGNMKFKTAASAISQLVKRGLVSGLSRTSAGLFVATWSETFSTPDNVIVLPTAMPAGWTLNEVSRTGNTYTFTTLNAGVATDPTVPVGLAVFGDYD